MFGTTFYFSLTRRYVALFGTLFNDLQVPRYDNDGNISQMLHVPLVYSGWERTMARLKGDPDLDRPSSTLLPCMSFELGGISYDGQRHLNPVRRATIKKKADGIYKAQYMPVPYDINFSLYMFSRYTEDGTKMLEQILPFFTPEFTVTANLIPEMDVQKDIYIILKPGVILKDDLQGDFSKPRLNVWQLDFVLKGYYYGPIKEHPIIKFSNVNFYDSTRFDNIRDAVGNSSPIDRVTVQPGLTANGEPTSNASLTVPYSQIEVTDDFGYVTYIAGNLDAVHEGTGGDQSNNINYPHTID